MRLVLCLTALVAAVMAQTELEVVLKTANDQFNARMFQEVAKENNGESIVLSAFSVLCPLAQLALASVGESHDEILKCIGFPNDNVTKEVFTDVNRRLKSVSGVELKQANKIYVRDGLFLSDIFAAISKSVFNSEVENINFNQNEKAAKDINTWVEDQTNKRIKDLVAPNSITSDTVALLVNAIYFKGNWQKPFNKQRTQDRDFHVTDEKTIKVPMMMKRDHFNYGESKELDAKILELPYEGGETSLIIVLPNKVNGIDELIQKISDVAVLNTALGKMYMEEVEVALPRFKIETKTDLKEILQRMEIKKLFMANEAKLNNLLKTGDLFVSDAVQKAFIEVNEEGSEAAAANNFGIAYLSAIISEPLTFVADHPFIFFLREKDNILFNGVFRD